MTMEEAVRDYADRYLSPYKMRKKADGSVEYFAKECPVCHSPKQYKFSINSHTGFAHCFRGGCDFHGSIYKLLSMAGEKPVNIKNQEKAGDFMAVKKNYRQPKEDIVPLTDKCREYMHRRGFSDETIDAFDLVSDKNGNIVFNFTKDGKLVYRKFRKPEKYVQGHGEKEWTSPGSMEVLWNMDKINPELPVYLTEGQFDAMALFEAGFCNVVSVPAGCNHTQWIDNCWDFIEQVKTWVIFGDSDEPGQQMVSTLKTRLSVSQVRFVPIEAYPAKDNGDLMKDANEILIRRGADGIKEVLDQAEDTVISGLLDFGEIEYQDPTTIPRIPTGFKGLDEAIGGFLEGGLSVITGETGKGKSTVCGLMLLNAIERGFNCAMYSGELTKEELTQWIFPEVAGDSYLVAKEDSRVKKTFAVLPAATAQRINEYLAGRLWLYDNKADDIHTSVIDSITSKFEIAVRRFGTKLLMVDNVMSLTMSMEENENAAQAYVIQMLKRFAMKYSVHILLVAHLNKSFNGAMPGVNFISGNSIISKTADQVILLHEQRMKVLKNRMDGRKKTIPYVYCPASKRIYEESVGDLYPCSWNKEGIPKPPVDIGTIEGFKPVLPPPEENPF